MVINMECGNFGSRAQRIGIDLPLSRFDAAYGSLSRALQRLASDYYLSA